MAIQNIPIPSYLEPPSQGEQEQLKLERDRMQQQQADQIAKKIQSKVAMEKLIGDTRVAQAGGMDPQEAQQAALYSNAPSLFPNDPEKVTQLQSAILQKQKFQQAKKEYQASFDADVKGGMSPEAAFAKNWSHYAPDLVPGTSLGPTMSRTYATEQAAVNTGKKLALDETKFRDTQALKKVIEENRNTRFNTGLIEKASEFDAKQIQQGQQFLSKEDRQSQQFDKKITLDERKVKVAEDKAGVGANPIKPVVEVINGVKVMYVPGSKNVHVIQEDSNLRTFLLKNVPALMKSTGLPRAEAEKQLKDVWESANKAGADEAAKNPTPGSTAPDANDPLGILKK